MRPILLLMTLLLVACGSASSTDRLLAEVWARDQQPRLQLQELTKAVTVEGRMELIDSLLVVVDRVERLDAENMAVVDSLLQEGLPRGLSEASYKTIWIVIDHAELEVQERYLPLIEEMAAAGLVARSEWAVLHDRVSMKNNRPQRYGSQSVQFGKAERTQLYLWPVEAPERLDSLRVTVGLSPLSDYLRQLTEAVGITAQYDPALTVEELNAFRENQVPMTE
ncbi:MAG: hypothetical protein IJ028_06220 [Alistipes sp.]|nr:hypothetical protein [Alistipes sp.]